MFISTICEHVPQQHLDCCPEYKRLPLLLRGCIVLVALHSNCCLETCNLMPKQLQALACMLLMTGIPTWQHDISFDPAHHVASLCH